MNRDNQIVILLPGQLLRTLTTGSRCTVFHLPCPETIKREARAVYVQEQELRHVKGAQEERTGTRVNDGDPTDSVCIY